MYVCMYVCMYILYNMAGTNLKTVKIFLSGFAEIVSLESFLYISCMSSLLSFLLGENFLEFYLLLTGSFFLDGIDEQIKFQ